MANWKTTVKIGDLHESYRNKEITAGQLSRLVCLRFRLNRYIKAAIDSDSPDYDWDIENTLEEMEEGVEDADHYDNCLSTLYSFGDAGHCIWIDTIEH